MSHHASEKFAWRPLERRHRSDVEGILRSAGVFAPEEIDVALEVLDAYTDEPEEGYESIGAFTDHGELVGFAFYGATPCTVGTWDLYWIAVRPSHQRSGIGRELVSRVEAELRAAGARLCVIETSSRSDYENTRHFYEKCGYREDARVTDFYGEGDDRVTFVKHLGPKRHASHERETRR